MSSKLKSSTKTGRTTDLSPKLRFPEFRDTAGWESRKVDDLVDTVTPFKKLQTSEYRLKGKFPIVDQSPNSTCGWTNDGEAVVEEGLPLIVFGDHTCALKFVDRPFAQGADGIKIVRPKHAIDARFLFYTLEVDPVKQDGYKRHFSILREKELSFPAFATGEQQKIADCLGSVDALIALQGQKVETLRVHKNGLMRQLFPQKGEAQPGRRFPEFEGSGEWEEGTLSNIGTVLQGYGFPEKYQGLQSGDFPFYKVSDISRSLSAGKTFLQRAANYVNQNHLKELRAKPIPVGTTVFAKIGEAIRSNRRAITTIPCLVDNNAAGVKSIKGKATDFFIYLTMEQISLIDHAGGVVPAVNKSAIEAIPVRFPKIAEQQRIADCLISLDDRISAEARKLDTLKTHKKGLLQQLFPRVAEDAA